MDGSMVYDDLVASVGNTPEYDAAIIQDSRDGKWHCFRVDDLLTAIDRLGIQIANDRIYLCRYSPPVFPSERFLFDVAPRPH